MTIKKKLDRLYTLGLKHGNSLHLVQLEEFQKSFNSSCNYSPTVLTKLEWELRHDLLHEELHEYKCACIDEDKVEILDALVDQMYILCGTIVSHGMQNVFNEAFKRVHENNMSKLVNGKPIINEVGAEHYDSSKPVGKVLKPKNYVPVDLTDLIT